MPFICLPKDRVDAFKRALRDKTLKMSDLFNMETGARTELLAKYVGKEDAKTVNLLFEEKLILKNQLQGIKNWASKVGEIGRYDPAKKVELDRLMSEFRARQQERIFSPKESEAFLSDLVEAKFGTLISKEAAKDYLDLTKRVDDLRKNFNEKTGSWSSEKDRLRYGGAKVLLENYIERLKGGDMPLNDLLRESVYEIRQVFKENVPAAVWGTFVKTLRTISDTSISMVASVDNSFMGRQGLKTLFTDWTRYIQAKKVGIPYKAIWWPGAKQSFVDFAKTIGGQRTKDALLADIYSRPNYLNGRYSLAKLMPRAEEQFPTRLPERVPILGRVYSASQIAFEGSAIRMRTGLYDFIESMAEKNGVDVADKHQVQSIGRVVNSLTARGQWGTRGEPAFVRLILWAPKMLKGNIDVLTAHAGQHISPFARRQAAYNLAGMIVTNAVIMAIANAIKPGSTTTDTNSSDFGKIKVGNTRIDHTGGAASLVVLASRMLTGEYTSSVTGIKSEYGAGYGEVSRFDAFIDFLTGKTAPFTRMLIDFAKEETFEGRSPTFGSAVGGITVPISIQNFIKLKDDSSVAAVLGAILDVFGVSANTYAPRERDWTQDTGVELQAFRERVGDEKFKEANDRYNQEYAEWVGEVIQKSEYKDLSDDDKKSVLSKKKEEIKDRIFRQYGFKYKSVKTAPLLRF